MSMRNIVTAVIIVIAFVAGALFQKMITPAQSGAGGAQQAAGDASAPPSASGGTPQVAAPPAEEQPQLAWDVPSDWTDAGPRQMRFATYDVPAAPGDSAGAECAVFYFGSKQGGGVDDNIDRWVGQFDHPSQPVRSSRSVNGFDVKRVEVEGAYLAPAGPMMQSTGAKPGYMLLGAIVKGPNGLVFFKLTGPEKTIRHVSRAFDGMLASIRHA